MMQPFPALQLYTSSTLFKRSSYNFFSGSTHRWIISKTHIKNCSIIPLISETRWEIRIEALKPLRYHIDEVYDQYDAVIEATTEGTKWMLCGKIIAFGIAKKLAVFRFLYFLITWYMMFC